MLTRHLRAKYRHVKALTAQQHYKNMNYLPNIRCILSLLSSNRVLGLGGVPGGWFIVMVGFRFWDPNTVASSVTSKLLNPAEFNQSATACRIGAQELR